MEIAVGKVKPIKTGRKIRVIRPKPEPFKTLLSFGPFARYIELYLQAPHVNRIMNRKLPLMALVAMFSLAACNAPAYHSQANFNAAGQALGNGNVGAGASYTGHAFAEGAQATGQAIGTGAQQAGHAINNTFNGNNGN
jgi:hypothetical protein